MGRSLEPAGTHGVVVLQKDYRGCTISTHHPLGDAMSLPCCMSFHPGAFVFARFRLDHWIVHAKKTADRQTDRQTHRQGRKTDKKTDRHTDRQMGTNRSFEMRPNCVIDPGRELHRRVF